jgi:hypothetical protein
MAHTAPNKLTCSVALLLDRERAGELEYIVVVVVLALWVTGVAARILEGGIEGGHSMIAECGAGARCL